MHTECDLSNIYLGSRHGTRRLRPARTFGRDGHDRRAACIRRPQGLRKELFMPYCPASAPDLVIHIVSKFF